MNNNIKNILKFTIFAGFGILLLWLVYKDQDFSELIQKMGIIRWWWFVPAISVMMFAHVIRAIRWNLLLDSVSDTKPRFINTFFATLIMYFVNLAIPRLGEVTRSGLVSRYNKVPFSKVLGTMVTERATDMLVLIVFTFLVVILQGHVVSDFLSENPEFRENIGFLLDIKFWLIFGLIGLGGLYILYLIAKGRFDKYQLFAKTGEFIRSFMFGIKSIFLLKKPWLFIGHSFFIFILYLLMLWISFHAFPDIPHLNGLAALTIFVAGSYGMVAPAPNGMGAWHFMTIQSMIIYSVPEGDAKLFALIVHSLQMIILIISGLIALIGLPLVNKHQL
jgi:glycosyltransferase 2 family protein